VYLNRMILFVLFDWPPGAEAQAIYGASTYWIWFYLAWAAAALAAIYSARVREEQRMRAKAQELAHHAQMRTLRYQLNPHFLFNTLNSVSALVLDNEPENADRMIRKLADFLRSGLDSDPLQDIPLAAELELQLTYLDIERTRFPDRLQVDVRVPDDLRNALVPGFILQPLIENAVKHVVARSADVTTITIEACAAGVNLILSVQDDGPMRPQANGVVRGIGLANTAERLATRFGSDHRFSAAPLEPKGFRVELTMPLRTASQ
jgi:LytS/YehU family sensor histidine kinase